MTSPTSNPMTPETVADAPAKVRIVIERTHPSQTDAGLAVLNHLANQPEGCTFEVIYAVFVEVKDSLQAAASSAHNLRNMLCHLVERGQIKVGGGRGAQRIYLLGDLAKLPSTAKAKVEFRNTLKAKAQAVARESQTVYVGEVTPARRVNVMFGPVYVPAPSAMLRTGSLDFTRLASRGNRC